MQGGTIFALSTALGRSGVAVVRVSGKDALSSLQSLCARHVKPRQAELVQLINPKTEQIIDDALVIWFPKPRSFTGEDTVEYHVHGSHAVIDSLILCLGETSGLRHANPGEFTRRAFENGKMDLTAAEGLADLIEAETEIQKKQAFRQMKGQLGVVYENWRKQILRDLSYIEAVIDFADEEIPNDLFYKVNKSVKRMIVSIENHLNDSRRGERIREGIHVAIIGEPNVGKSSLLNALIKRNIAIVSKGAGTTRDIIETNLDLDGYPVILFDTAGLRESDDIVEVEGIRRAREKAEDADLKIVVLDGINPFSESNEIKLLKQKNSIIVFNKVDLLSAMDKATLKKEILVSAKTGEGTEDILNHLKQIIQKNFCLPETAVITKSRHRLALLNCVKALKRVWSLEGNLISIELAAEEMRMAARFLGRITGQVDVEDILEKIFSDFCIGK